MSLTIGTTELNRIIDQRPTLRARGAEALRETQGRLDNLVAAIESGGSSSSLVEAVRAREADFRRLQTDLEALSDPLEQKLAVMPTWVRRQLEDMARFCRSPPSGQSWSSHGSACRSLYIPWRRKAHGPSYALRERRRSRS